MQRDEEDEAWQAIVENYGERPVVGDDAPPEDDVVPSAEEDLPDTSHSDVLEEEPEQADPDPWDEGFVPPSPPPVPRPPLDRLAAWCGLVGAPAVLVLLALFGIDLPDGILLLLAGAFVGGFGYLVLTMGRSPRPPWDDGAEV